MGSLSQKGFTGPDQKERKKRWIGRRGEDVLAALSVANLVYFRAWRIKFLAYGHQAALVRYAPKPLEFVALAAATLVLALALYALFRWIRWLQFEPTSPAKLTGMAATGAVCILLGSLVALNSPLVSAISARRLVVGGSLIGLAYALIYLLKGRLLLRITSFGLVALSPSLFLTFGESLFRMARYDPKPFADGPTSPRLPAANNAPHVVWMIFDAWDEGLSFKERPAGLELPELDRLRAEAFYSDAVFQPGPVTDVSMPALTVGRQVLESSPDGPRDLNLYLRGAAQPVKWSALPNIFGAARSLGLNTGVIGWYVPYCRVISSSLTGCEYFDDSYYYKDAGFPRVLWNAFRFPTEPITYLRSPFGQNLWTMAHAGQFRHLMTHVKSTLVEQEYNLTLTHVPIPHLPFFYDVVTDRDDLGAKPSLLLSNSPKDYLSALALVDKTLGDLRRTLEAAGVWDTTTLLLSADHPNLDRSKVDGRPFDKHVPYILKLAGQHETVQGKTPFNALLTHDLLLAILKKDISTATEADQWIAAHQHQFPLYWDTK
jgi:hypothetical protein